MPTFIKSNSGKKTSSSGRTFVSRSRKLTRPTRKKPTNNPTKQANNRKTAKQVEAAKERVLTDIENKKSLLNKLSHEPESESVKGMSNKDHSPETDQELADIQKLIQQATNRLAQIDEERVEQHDQEVESDQEPNDPEEFNGVSDKDEHLELLEAELEAARRESKRLKHELDAIKQEFEAEKKKLENSVKSLKKDLRREAPLHGHSFFSLSKDLKGAMEAIEKLTEGEILDSPDLSKLQGGTLPDTTTPQTSDNKPDTKPQPEQAKSVTKNPEDNQKEETEEASEDKKSDKQKSKKKLLITGGVAAALVLGLSTILAGGLSQPGVNQDLVQEYLQNEGAEGTVQGVQDDQQAPDASPQPPPQLSDNDRHKTAQAEVSFAESVWEQVTEPFIGVSFEYPVNAVSIVKTDSSLTLLRKSGYIFKVSRIDTGLRLADYWQQISATSLNYDVQETELAGFPALHLDLRDAVDFPGNRYLVQLDKAIMDVWYSIPSDKFSDDDIKRVERVVDSISFDL